MAHDDMAILRERAGDYVRGLLAEVSGFDGELVPLATLPGAVCSRDLCAANLVRDGRRWHILATRTTDFVDFEPLARACAAADIVVSDRRLPSTCRPRWFKADRPFLEATGGLAVTLGSRPTVVTVAEQSGQHPWAGRGGA